MKIFISGSKEISKLPREATNKIIEICNKKHDILIGDCYGIDTTVQTLLKQLNYKKVTIFTSCEKERVNLGNWKVVNINSDKHGYCAHAEKDKAMINACDYGIAIWNGKSKGTGNNITGLKKKIKKFIFFMLFNKTAPLTD